MSEYVPEWVTKIDVAIRLIRAAIRLQFEECDPVALHSIVAAAHRLISDLAHHRHIDPSRLDKLDRHAANFFKHADRDPNGRVNIEPLRTLTEMLLFDAVQTLTRINPDIPHEAKLYWSWYMVNNEQDFRGAGPAIDDIIRNSQMLKAKSKHEILQLLRLQQILNADEPLPGWAQHGPTE